MELSRINLAVLRAGGRPKIPGKGQGLASSSTVVCTICPRVGIGLSDWPKIVGKMPVSVGLVTHKCVVRKGQLISKDFCSSL